MTKDTARGNKSGLVVGLAGAMYVEEEYVKGSSGSSSPVSIDTCEIGTPRHCANFSSAVLLFASKRRGYHK